MAGKRSRRSSYRRRYKRRRPSKRYILRLANRAIARTIQLKSEERRIYFAEISNNDVSFVNSIYPLTTIPIGQGQSNREGERIVVKSIYLNGLITAPVVQASVKNGLVRMAIIWYNGDFPDPSGGMPMIPKRPEIWDGTADLGTTTIFQPRNLNYTNMWKIIWEKVYRLDELRDGMQRVVINLKMNHVVHYVSTGLQDARKGHLWFVSYSNYLAAPFPQFDSIMRLRYTDD